MVKEIIDIFKQYPNYFVSNYDANLMEDKLGYNNFMSIFYDHKEINSPDTLIFYPQFTNAVSIKSNLDLFYFFNTTISYKINIHNNRAYVDNSSKFEENIELKNIIEKVEDFIKEYEKRYKLYNYIKYTNAIKKI